MELSEWLKTTASPRAWLAHQKKNYQLHAKLTQIEGIVKTHLAKVNFDREALDMDIRYIYEPEKVEADRKSKEETTEAERKALAKREAAREKARLKAEEKKRKEDEKNRLIWSFLVQFIDDIKSGARKIGSADYSAGSCKAWKSYIGVYEGFDPLYQFEWADINRAFVARYINYLRNHGYMPKVVNKHLTNLKALINAAFIDGVHDNQRAASLTDLNGNVIVPRYDCVTSHTARRTGITNMYLSHKYTILQMMHVSGHKTQKTFMDYIKLSSEEIADEIAFMSKKESDMW